MKNIKINEKKIASLLLALGIMITPHLSTAEIKSYGVDAKLINGDPIVLYYANEYDKSFVSYDGTLGFIENKYISDMYFDTNDYFAEANYDDYISNYRGIETSVLKII